METAKYAVKKLEKLCLEYDDKNNSAIKLPLAIHYFLNGDLNNSKKLVNSYFANPSNIQKIKNKDGIVRKNANINTFVVVPTRTEFGV